MEFLKCGKYGFINIRYIVNIQLCNKKSPFCKNKKYYQIKVKMISYKKRCRQSKLKIYEDDPEYYIIDDYYNNLILKY